MTRPMIGTVGMPWLQQHAAVFEATVRAHGYGNPEPDDSQELKNRAHYLLRDPSKHDRKRLSLAAHVNPAYIERLSWYEFNPTTGHSGTREVSKVRAVLRPMGWTLESWLAMCDGQDLSD